MQTRIHPDLAVLPQVKDAESILRACVHCGFCTATCPTYQLTGDELDGPRGRIYLIKNLLEDNAIDDKAVVHLDRCLTCRSCETTCPSGVQYGRLLDIARDLIVTRSTRPAGKRVLSALLRWIVPRRYLFESLLRAGQLFRPVLPRTMAKKIPQRQNRLQSGSLEVKSPHKTVLLLQGCVQRSVTPRLSFALPK